MPFKPKSLDDINSLYDSDIAAARAIEEGKSKIQEETPSPTVFVPPTEEPSGESGESVRDISSVVDDFIRAMNSGEIASKPSRIKIDSDREAGARKPAQRSGVQAPRTGVQGLSRQQAQGGPVVTNSAARQATGERPFRGGQAPYDAEEGGPSYARQKAAAEEARRQANELEKQRRQEEYRKMLSTEGSGRRTSEDMDEFINEYASVMNDEDEGRRARRQRRRAPKTETVVNAQPEEAPPAEEGDPFESFFHDVTDDISEEERHQSTDAVRSSDFDGVFDGTDMETLPYSVKRYIYEQKLMYEEQARLTQEAYDRRIAEDYARSQAEQDQLRAEQERIRREAEERHQRDAERLAEREKEYRRQKELLERRSREEAEMNAEEVRHQGEEIRRLLAERDRLIAEQEALSIQMKEDALAVQEREKQRDEEYAALTAEKDRIQAQREALEAQIREEAIAAEEYERLRDDQYDALAAERDALIAKQEELERRIEEENRIISEKERVYNERYAFVVAERDRLLAGQGLNPPEDEEFPNADDGFETEERSPEIVEEDYYSSIAPETFEEGEGAEAASEDEEVLDKRTRKQKLKEERALDRAAEKEMVREAKERAKAEKRARKAAKRGEELPIDEMPSDEDGAVADEIEEEPIPEAPEAALEAEGADEPENGGDVVEKPKRGGARAFVRFILSLVLIGSIAACGVLFSLSHVLNVNTGKKAVFGNYYFFTINEDISRANVRAGDIVIFKGVDSAKKGESVAYLITREDGSKYFSIGTKKSSSVDSNGNVIYNFEEKTSAAHSDVLGIVKRSFSKVGTVVDLLLSHESIFLVAFAALALLCFVLVVFVLRNKSKAALKREKKALKARKEEEKKTSGEEESVPDRNEPGFENETGDESSYFDEISDAASDEYEDRLPQTEESSEGFGDPYGAAFSEDAPAETDLRDEAAGSYEELPRETEPDESNLDDLSRWLDQLGETEAESEMTPPAEENEPESPPVEENQSQPAVTAPVENLPGPDEFEDIVSSDDSFAFDDDDDDDDAQKEPPYQPGDESFFGDSGNVFGDFEGFEEDESSKSKRSSRKKKKHDKKRQEDRYPADADNQDDVFDSL